MTTLLLATLFSAALIASIYIRGNQKRKHAVILLRNNQRRPQRKYKPSPYRNH